eukprot:9466978-Pyramimonas_sp.AAC.2
MYVWAVPSQIAHPRRSPAMEAEVFAQYSAAQPCCMDKHFTLKLGALFGSADGLKASTPFRRLVATWGFTFVATGMYVERLLSLTRQCCDSGSGLPGTHVFVIQSSFQAPCPQGWGG